MVAGLVGCSDFEVRRALAYLGYEPAQELVGLMYATGLQVEQDLESAHRWLTKSAESGNRRSQFHLATLYSGEDGFPPDAGAMLHWLHRAADAGHAGAQARLGEMYLTGDSVERNRARGLEWLRLASGSGNLRAQTNLAFFQLLPGLDGQAPTAEARREAIALMLAAANAGFHPAQLNLATIYLEEGSPDANLELGILWLERAATAGNDDARAALGELDRPASPSSEPPRASPSHDFR